MKILMPITNFSHLAISAVAAVGLHLAMAGVGPGILSHPLVPEIQSSNRCESVTFIERAPILRERVEQPERERVVSKEAPSPVKQESSRQAVKSRKHPIEKVHQERLREKREPVTKVERSLVVEERERKPCPPSGTKEIALSRAPAPCVDSGFKPIYPAFAKRYGCEGRLELKVTVSAAGKVTAVEVVRSSGYAILDKSAMRQVKEIPFRPGLSNSGQPEEATVVWGIDFHLDD